MGSKREKEQKMMSKNEIRGLKTENDNLNNENSDLKTQIENLNRQQMNLNEQFIVLKSESIKMGVIEVMKREISQEIVMKMVDEQFEKWWKEEYESRYILQTK